VLSRFCPLLLWLLLLLLLLRLLVLLTNGQSSLWILLGHTRGQRVLEGELLAGAAAAAVAAVGGAELRAGPGVGSPGALSAGWGGCADAEMHLRRLNSWQGKGLFGGALGRELVAQGREAVGAAPDARGGVVLWFGLPSVVGTAGSTRVAPAAGSILVSALHAAAPRTSHSSHSRSPRSSRGSPPPPPPPLPACPAHFPSYPTSSRALMA